LGTESFNAHTKYRILKHGQERGNIKATCELFGISRGTYYNWMDAYKKNGMTGLEEKEKKKPVMPNKVAKDIEEEILYYVSKYPKDGPKRIYYELKSEGHDLGESGIFNVLKRNHLSRRSERMAFAMGGSIIKNRRRIDRIPHFRKEKDSYPGHLMVQRLDFMGTYEGVGKIYQYTLYDQISRWAIVQIYNTKQEIDLWNYFEVRLLYLIKTFNLSVENLVTLKDKNFLAYFLKGDRSREILENFKIRHIFLEPQKFHKLSDLDDFHEDLIRDFYEVIEEKKSCNSFLELERSLQRFIREYNFNHEITHGVHKGQTPVKVVLDRAKENGADLDALPLWILALLKTAEEETDGKEE